MDMAAGLRVLPGPLSCSTVAAAAQPERLPSGCPETCASASDSRGGKGALEILHMSMAACACVEWACSPERWVCPRRGRRSYGGALCCLCCCGGCGGHYGYLGQPSRELLWSWTCGLCGLGLASDLLRLDSIVAAANVPKPASPPARAKPPRFRRSCASYCALSLAVVLVTVMTMLSRYAGMDFDPESAWDQAAPAVTATAFSTLAFAAVGEAAPVSATLAGACVGLAVMAPEDAHEMRAVRKGTSQTWLEALRSLDSLD